MKKTKYIQIAFASAMIIATLLLVASCGSNQNDEDSKEMAEEHNDAKFEDNKQEEDAQFLVNAAEINLHEIQLAQLAQQKGKSAHILELAKIMEEAHSKSQRDLVSLANRKSITIPSSPTNDANDVYADLNEKSGIDFDKAYANELVDGHEDAVETFENASRDCSDLEIKNWAKTTLPDLRTHLDRSMECQKKTEKL